MCVDRSEKESETARCVQEFLQAGCVQRRECVLMRAPARNHRRRMGMFGTVILTIATAVSTTIEVVPMNAHTTAAAARQNSMSVPGALSSRLSDNDTVTNTITVGTTPAGVAVTPDGSTVYVTNRGSDSVSVIDTATGTVTKTITVGLRPFGVAVTPDGSTVYVASYESDSVSRIDTATRTVTKTITVGMEPAGVVVTPDGSAIYVAVPGSAS